MGNWDFTGDDLASVLLSSASYKGVSGRIRFSQGHGGAEGYGLGDREVGLYYQIINFNGDNYHSLSNYGITALRNIGNWDNDISKYILCDNNRDELCSDTKYNTRDGSRPIDIPDVIEIQMSTTNRNIFRALGALCLFVCVWFIFVFLLYLDTKLVKAAEPSVIFTVLFGAILGSIRIMLATVDITDSLCIAGKWIGHLSFFFVFGAMIVKIWRLDKVVNSKLSKVKITKRDMHRMLVAGFILFLAYLMMDTLVGKPHQSYVEYFNGHYNVRLIKCLNENNNTTLALFAIEGFSLLYGARLCWNTKNVNNAVNDGQYISLGK